LDKVIVSILFVVTYLGIILTKKYRAMVIWSGIIIILLATHTKLIEILYYVNWNVIGIFAGTLVLADYFIFSKVPVLLSNIIMNRAKTVGMAILGVCILTSFISAFIENVATVLIIIPIALAISRKLKIDPTYFIIGIAICSNLQGTATLVGDPPSMILAGIMKLNFNDFFFLKGKPGIFFAVELGAIASFAVLYFFFRRFKQEIGIIEKEKVTSWVPTILIIGMIIGLALAPLFDPDFLWFSGTICLIFASICIIWGLRLDKDTSVKILRRYDWDTTFFLMGIFIMVGFLESYNIIETIKNGIVAITGKNVFLSYTFIVWISVVFSAFICNIPYVTAMLPIMQSMAVDLGTSPFLLGFGLLVGSCLCGNITPIGASANIVSVGILKKEGYLTSFWTFVKLGLPFTIAATVIGYLFILFIWG